MDWKDSSEWRDIWLELMYVLMGLKREHEYNQILDKELKMTIDMYTCLSNETFIYLAYDLSLLRCHNETSSSFLS